MTSFRLCRWTPQEEFLVVAVCASPMGTYLDWCIKAHRDEFVVLDSISVPSDAFDPRSGRAAWFQILYAGRIGWIHVYACNVKEVGTR